MFNLLKVTANWRTGNLTHRVAKSLPNWINCAGLRIPVYIYNQEIYPL